MKLVLIMIITLLIQNNLNALINISNSTYCTQLNSKKYKFTTNKYEADLKIYFQDELENSDFAISLTDDIDQATISFTNDDINSKYNICIDEYAINTKIIYISNDKYTADVIISINNNYEIENKLYNQDTSITEQKVIAIIYDILKK